jgi:hypothetical protein
MESIPCSPEDIAKERFENYVNERLNCENREVIWELHTYLLRQAKKHKSPTVKNIKTYISFIDDRNQAVDNVIKKLNSGINFP